jgi:hypothetical protein
LLPVLPLPRQLPQVQPQPLAPRPVLQQEQPPVREPQRVVHPDLQVHPVDQPEALAHQAHPLTQHRVHQPLPMFKAAKARAMPAR